MTEISFLASRPVIVGSGVAGLTVALAMAPTPVVLLSAKALGEESSSALAQGGIAAAIGSDDSPVLHAEDTEHAGVGLCLHEIVRLVTQDGPLVIERLVAKAVEFDRDENGVLALGLEAAHRRRRIVHSNGDGTGRVVTQALVALAKATPSIEIIEDAVATDLLLADGAIAGIAFKQNGRAASILTSQVILATGGAGALWLHTTNPTQSWGHGLALAARAGALMTDLEFVQFHPTAIDVAMDPMPLASETLRGEGAALIDETGARFMAGQGRAELEPRDVVARAIWSHRSQGHQVFLDTRQEIGASFPTRFPTIYALCKKAGIDPVAQPIPVRPAAHYHMGGILVDARGRSSVEGLWACGEVAATGLHGANRLASNSLLEAAAFGYRVAKDVEGTTARKLQPVALPLRRTFETAEFTLKIRQTMSAFVGVLRDRAGLEQAVQTLQPMARHSDRALSALMIAYAALQRTESRGGHARTDYPSASALWERRQVLSIEDVSPNSITRSVALPESREYVDATA